MNGFASIRNRIAKLGPRPKGWKRKPTTAENRQELERFLKEIESRPKPAVARVPTPAEAREIDEARAELDRIASELEKRIADDAREAARPWGERGKP